MNFSGVEFYRNVSKSLKDEFDRCLLSPPQQNLKIGAGSRRGSVPTAKKCDQK